ncbi:gamma-glutamyltransferase family protein [Flavimaricola marinus]|uniref:Putative gamma-glutamyltransferase YwrD n=1 Tax=Flavimaricola marinus TaxID=1819565 RepID=A0A238LGV9_9RHOB|nr:gamma-glutamyltransferase family protein [Flavimaricola marinus]SMY08196.1 Putative gamma-glutamyltransferase YwrD [Flavimaricola marinus]
MRDFQRPGRSVAYATNGMCATSHPLAAKVAVQLLEAGGNAVDAAIAGAVLLGQCEPAMTGIGGDLFALISPPGGEVVALNGSGRAPAGLSAAAMRDAGHATVPLDGPEAVTLPGAVDAFCRMSADWGKIGLRASLAPAIHYAEAGIPVAPRAALDWAMHQDKLKGAARRHFLIDDSAPRAGQIFRAPQLAEVLRRIATEGRDGFYAGEVAEDMASSLQALGGTHSLQDYEDTRSDYGKPISGTYAGVDLLEHPPNGVGAMAILMLNMLSHFDLSEMDPFGTERAHLEAEVAKLGFDARNRFIADPDHVSRLEHMLAPETAAELAKLISMKKALPFPAPLAEAVHKETVYLTVVDKDRMAVSLIYSVFKDFGTGLASEKFGIPFHNRGAGFTLEAGHPNEAGPGKRPMHTILPGMLRENGRIFGSFGVMGGGYQPIGHARFLTNMRDFGMDVQEAIDGPRCFFENGKLLVERGYAPEVHQGLADLGHDVVVPPRPIGGAQAILIGEDGVLSAGSDPRKDGMALGY